MRQILSGAIELFGRSWRTLVPIAAIAAVPSVPIAILLGVIIEVGAGSGTGASPEGSVVMVLAVVLLQLGLVFLQFVVTGALTWAASWALLDRDVGVIQAYRRGLSLVWSVLLVAALTALAVLVGFVLLVVPGFVVLTRLWVGVPVLVVEGARGRAALVRSWRLVKGRSWAVFWAIVSSGIIAGLVTAVVSVPFAAAGSPVQAAAQALGQVVATPFVTLVTVLVYVDLRVRKEGVHRSQLEQELGAVGR